MADTELGFGQNDDTYLPHDHYREQLTNSILIINLSLCDILMWCLVGLFQQ